LILITSKKYLELMFLVAFFPVLCKSLWIKAANILNVTPVTAPAGSDSPDQALEAEEVVRQLEIEQQVEELPASTATTAQDLPTAAAPLLYPAGPPIPTSRHPLAPAAPPLTPPPPPPPPPQEEEEEEERGEEAGELEPDIDLPPLTGNRRGYRGWVCHRA